MAPEIYSFKDEQTKCIFVFIFLFVQQSENTKVQKSVKMLEN